MDGLVICLAAFFASGLTLFSGFGLGTLLLPTFALFFPVPWAVAMTAVVHLLNNLFKLALLGRYARIPILLRFGIPALISAPMGAWVLVALSNQTAIFTYRLGALERSVLPVKGVVALLMACFALMEVLPRFKDLSFSPKYLPVGGILSGFFGGLSGHQGAFRSAFLAKCALSKEGFLGTGVVIAILVDLARIPVYAEHLRSAWAAEHAPLLWSATGSAFLGAWIGSRFLGRVTLRCIQRWVALLLFSIAAGLALGLI